MFDKDLFRSSSCSQTNLVIVSFQNLDLWRWWALIAQLISTSRTSYLDCKNDTPRNFNRQMQQSTEVRIVQETIVLAQESAKPDLGY